VKQFILTKEPDKDNTVRLKGNDYKYLVRVRRLAVGEFFPALLPNGEEIQIQITSIDSNTLTGKCLNVSIGSSDSSAPQTGEPAGSGSMRLCENISPVILFQAMPKGDKMDLIARQAAEGGITEIVPFISEFSIAKAVSADKQKFTRWERIIKEARQQSGSKIATSLRPVLSMNELFEYWQKLKKKDSTGLLFHHIPPENSSCGGLETKSLHEYLYSNLKKTPVVFVIGPEGGFSEKEVSLFLENGFNHITIGDTILRTETAALYCAAAIRVILLERNTWEMK